jgi:drug/metabolite transporter (DMT)-like permease
MSERHTVDAAELVRGARAGDQAAQDALVGAYLPLVYNIVGRALNGSVDVDDVVQDTMLRAMRRLRALMTPESFRPWLATIAVHQVSTHLRRRDVPFIVGAGLVGVFLNSISFTYGTKLTTAATVALIFGTMPILTALFAAAGRIERLPSRFWIAAAVSFTGVCLVAFGSSHGISGHLLGYVLALVGVATWAAYSVTIAPLMTRYTASRISAFALTIGAIPLLLVASPQLASQDFGALSTLVWIALAFAVLGPLFLTNLLWFNSIERVGPSRASIYANLQPFFGAVFALLILGESMTRYQIAGGLLIGAGIVLSRHREPALVPSEDASTG